MSNDTNTAVQEIRDALAPYSDTFRRIFLETAAKELNDLWPNAKKALKELPKEAQAVMQIYAELIITEIPWGTSCTNDFDGLLTESEMQAVLSKPKMSFYKKVRELILLCIQDEVMNGEEQ